MSFHVVSAPHQAVLAIPGNRPPCSSRQLPLGGLPDRIVGTFPGLPAAWQERPHSVPSHRNKIPDYSVPGPAPDHRPCRFADAWPTLPPSLPAPPRDVLDRLG